MCGIFGYVGTKTNAASIVLEGLKSLEYRGYDSWGVAAVPAEIPNTKSQNSNKKTRIVVKKKAGKIGNASISDMPKSSFALGHTRWATHGGVTDINAHPHLDCTGTIAVVHNGIFENYEEVKVRLLKLGHHIVSQTDTEVTVHLIEEYKKRMLFTKAVQKAFNEMVGLDAIIAMNVDDGELVAVRNGSPLVVGFGAHENFVASDASALIPYTRQVHFLEDDEMAIISKSDIKLFNVKTGATVHPQKQHLKWTLSQVEKGAFAHFMLKEIYEQPGLVTDIAATAGAQTEKAADTMRHATDTYLVGCGSSHYACMAGTYMLSKIANHHANAVVGSEFGYKLDFLTPESFVIALSQSGETMDILESVKKAKAKGAKIFTLVNVPGSTLYRLADHNMLVGAGPEKAVASTKALVGMLAHMTLLSYALANKTQEGRSVLAKAGLSSHTVLSENSINSIKTLAKKLKSVEHMYVIGRGLSYAASLETALKIKEISYIHAEGLAAGELKHGTLALVTKGTPCIAFLPNDETYGANLAGAMEMKARGGYIIGISYKPHEVFDFYLHVDDAKEATVIPNIITGQLLAYYLTLERGLDPDMPRNLAKSVTVK